MKMTIPVKLTKSVKTRKLPNRPQPEKSAGLTQMLTALSSAMKSGELDAMAEHPADLPSSAKKTSHGDGVAPHPDYYSALSDGSARPAFLRYGASGVAGLILSGVLAVTMTALIHVDFVPVDAEQTAVFDINPVAEDIPPPERTLRPAALADIVVPPAPQQISTRETDRVEVAPIMIDMTAVDWTPPVLSRTDFVIDASDRDEQPILRPAPSMPTRADRSGHCIMGFDVNAEGVPMNIVATQCSNSVFQRASVKAVSRWRYRPKVQGGQAVTRRGLRNRIVFQLLDERGAIIPE